jgi:hypothetical protein
MTSTMLQENVTRESMRCENTRNCLSIFAAGSSIVLGLGLIGVTFTYVIHSYETKDFAPAVVVTLIVFVVFVWVLVDTYYSRNPPERRPCGCLEFHVTSQTPIRDPLIHNAEDACGNDDTDTDTDADTETDEM